MPRHTFFSFHYQADVWRAWNVRNSWVVRGGDDEISEGFFDRSVFEASKRESPQALKRFLKDGLFNTSVTCVLAGTQTWQRRWVRYEIARSLLRGNGILTVHIHGVADRSGLVARKGRDPLSAMGVYADGGNVYLAEVVDGRWEQYADYTRAIPAGVLGFAAPRSNTVILLSDHYPAYDFTGQNGRRNIGGWIEMAAGLAGR